ncbi:MAG TPA: PepSY-associated TM helix domain-containing protein [Pirellulales bacterium]|nr:PepSY-associated TM helix domain-containing protein [Pirellulales bacterium]
MTVRTTILKFHRWLALLATVPLMLLGLSGSVVTFENEIDRALNPKLWLVETSGEPLARQALLDGVQRGFPNDAIAALRLPAGDDRAVEIALRSGMLVYADPYTGDVLGTRRRNEIVAARIHQFHTNLLLGPPGSWINGMAASVLVLLSLSGLWLWLWPKTAAIRWRGSGRRFFYDAHSATGLYGAALWIIVGFTGAIMNFEAIAQPALYWLTRTQGVDPPPLTSADANDGSALAADEIIDAARDALPGAAVTLLSLPKKSDDVFVVYMKFPEDRTPAGRSRVYVDQYSGKVLWVTNTRTVPWGVWLWNQHRAVHTGDLFGWPSRLLICAASLLVAVQTVTGLVVWWQARRARGKAPLSPRGQRETA